MIVVTQLELPATTYCEANRLANQLAVEGHLTAWGVQILRDAPSSLSSFLAADCNFITYAHTVSM